MISRQVAEALLDIKAVSIVGEDQLFTWVSGIKSPVYCDNKMTNRLAQVRYLIANCCADMIIDKYKDVELIAGTATAGIPHAALVAQSLDLPMVYVRSNPKGHGKGKQIEGYLKPGSKVVLIEDLLSTGGSSMKACEALIEEGADVLSVLAIFSYNFAVVDEVFNSKGVAFETLTDYKTLLPIAVEKNYVDESSKDTLLKWSDNPKMFTEV